MKTTLGVIGGSGLYRFPELRVLREIEHPTPFGHPSSPIIEAEIENTRVLFLARHGREHTILPSEVNYRANIYALKELGAQWCIAFSAVGSLQEGIQPGDIVIPDQVIDRTYKRECTFFGHGAVAHVPFGTPYCPVLRGLAIEACRQDREGKAIHDSGTYVCMEGPAFSSRAESNLYRSWGGSLIGMTGLPEAKLAREAEIAYCTIALVTDYDCWRDSKAEVSVDEILRVLSGNAEFARRTVGRLAPKLAQRLPSKLAADSLECALMSKEAIPAELKAKLKPIIGRYLS